VAENFWSAIGPTVKRTRSPGASRSAAASGTSRSSRIGPCATSSTTREPGITYSPVVTKRSTTTPSKGARILPSATCFDARDARSPAALALAVAVSQLAFIRSSSARAITFAANNRSARAHSSLA
jgi:hypothetical protein